MALRRVALMIYAHAPRCMCVKVKKQQRRQQRQNIEEPEPPVYLEAKPSLTYPKEMWAEPDYDSDDVEHEQQKVSSYLIHSLIQLINYTVIFRNVNGVVHFGCTLS